MYKNSLWHEVLTFKMTFKFCLSSKKMSNHEPVIFISLTAFAGPSYALHCCCWIVPFLHLDFLNPLPYIPILGTSNSAANKNMMSKIWTNGILLSD